MPALDAGATARCQRCDAVLRRTHIDPLGRSLALHLAALALLGIACLMSLMTVSTAGMNLSADLFSGPHGLGRHGLWQLAVVVLFTTAVGPFLRLAGMAYVLLGLKLRRPPRHLRRVFAWLEHLRLYRAVRISGHRRSKTRPLRRSAANVIGQQKPKPHKPLQPIRPLDSRWLEPAAHGVEVA